MPWPPALEELPPLPVWRYWAVTTDAESLEITFREARSVGKLGCVLDLLFLAVLVFGCGGGMAAGWWFDSGKVVLIAYAVALPLDILLLLPHLIWLQTGRIRITATLLHQTSDGPWGHQDVLALERDQVQDVRAGVEFPHSEGWSSDCVEVELTNGSTRRLFYVGYTNASQAWFRDVLNLWRGLPAAGQSAGE